MKARTVGELRKLLEGVPDWVRVGSPAFDHRYREAHAGLELGIAYPEMPGEWSEDWDDDSPEDGGVRVPLLIIR